jgi:CDP-diacylglycerol--serine O-phosphatidyltransferase
VSWRPHLNLANAATAAGFTAGIAAILVVVSTGTPVPGGWLWTAAGLVVVAAGADLVDGTVARHYHTDGPFGHGLDTISDVVSFGVTPALVAYCAQLYRHPVPGAAVMVLWCVAVHWRLARYLVRGHQRSYIGCPCPLAAVLLVILVASGTGAYPVLAVMVALSVLMVSTISVPTWEDLVIAGRARRAPPAVPHKLAVPQQMTVPQQMAVPQKVAMPRRLAVPQELAVPRKGEMS